MAETTAGRTCELQEPSDAIVFYRLGTLLALLAERGWPVQSAIEDLDRISRLDVAGVASARP